jgi:hypothetical protein
MRYTENNSNKTFQTFVSEMFSTIGEATKWFPINAANPFAADSEMARRRKEEADARDAHYRTYISLLLDMENICCYLLHYELLCLCLHGSFPVPLLGITACAVLP